MKTLAPSDFAIWVSSSPVPPADPKVFLPWLFHIEANANAFVYFNGHLLGRYYAVGPQTDFWLPECWIKNGEKNIIALQARPTGNGPVIKRVELRPYSQFAETISSN